MSTTRTRLAVAAGTTLALVLAGTSIVAAQTPDTTAFGGGPGIGAMHGRGGFGGPGGFGGRGGFGGFDRLYRGAAIVDRFEDLVRQELTTLDDDGLPVTQRVEHGIVSAIAEGTLTITLPTGESVSVTADDDTDAYGWDTDARPFREEIEPIEIVAGDDVMAWSDSRPTLGARAPGVGV